MEEQKVSNDDMVRFENMIDNLINSGDDRSE